MLQLKEEGYSRFFSDGAVVRIEEIMQKAESGDYPNDLQLLIDRLVSKAEEKGCDEAQKNVIYALIGVSVPNFERTLDAIDARYGSLDNYLTEALGCDRILRDKLKARFLK